MKFCKKKLLATCLILMVTALVTTSVSAEIYSTKGVIKSRDVNSDGVVDIRDLAEVSANYNRKNTDVLWQSKYDINDDNIIDIYDFILVSKSIVTTTQIQHTFQVFDSLLPGKKTVVVKLSNVDGTQYDVFLKDIKLDYDSTNLQFIVDVLTADAVETNLKIVLKTTS